MEAIDPFVFRLSIFVLAIFVGYFVVWSVTPALHTPLMSVTNAISSVIVVGALIAVSVHAVSKPENVIIAVDKNEQIYWNNEHLTNDQLKQRLRAETQMPVMHGATSVSAMWTSKGLGFFALILACVNIFGGFLVTSRMLSMYKKKEK